ncbi:hypothetical protein QL285_057219 [Trifolium repens]|jgi:hypothetical protein|nr:hypothetical protein QL285_057219 [Trifolium repens]
MEAHKEKKEQVEKQEDNKRGSRMKKISDQINDDVKCKRELESDTMIKRIIRDNIISNGETAQAPNDVLAFSRSVHNVDSSLE